MATVSVLPPGGGSPVIILNEPRVDALSLEIDISDTVAVTRITASLANEANLSKEALFDIPLSPQAIVTNLTLTTHNDTLYGIVQERSKAQQVYNESKERGETTALLSSAGKGRLTLKVNLAAESQATLEASIVEVLPANHGLMVYEFPLKGFGGLGAFALDLAASSGPGWDAIRLSGVPAVRSGSGQHEAAWAFEASSFAAGEDLRLEIEPTDDAYRASMVLSAREANASAIFALMPPAGTAGALPKDIVFVLDRSGSMGGDKIVQAREALVTILGDLRAGDRFGLVAFDQEIVVYDSELKPSSAAEIGAAQEWVQGIGARGSTNIGDAVLRGFQIIDDPGAERLGMVVLITDGLPTAGITDPSQLVATIAESNAHDVRVHAVGIGFDQDNALLGEMASANRGHYQAVGPGADVSDALNDFYARVSTPLLKDLRIEFPGHAVTAIQPAPLPDVYAGSHLLFAGRLDASALPADLPVRIHANGSSGAVVFDLEIDADDASVHPEVDRLWARMRASAIERAAGLSTSSAERAGYEEELVVLGIAYQIETTRTWWVLANATTVADALREATDLRSGYLPQGGPGAFAGGGGVTGTTGATANTGTPTGSIRDDSSADGGGGGDPAPGGQTSARSPGLGLLGVVVGVVLVATLAGRRRRD